MWQIITGRDSGVKYLINLKLKYCLRFKPALSMFDREDFSYLSNQRTEVWMKNIRNVNIWELLEIEDSIVQKHKKHIVEALKECI